MADFARKVPMVCLTSVCHRAACQALTVKLKLFLNHKMMQALWLQWKRTLGGWVGVAAPWFWLNSFLWGRKIKISIWVHMKFRHSSTCFSVRGVRTPASLFPSRDPVSIQIYYKLGLLTHWEQVIWLLRPESQCSEFSLEQRSTIKSPKWRLTSHCPLLPPRHGDCGSPSGEGTGLTLTFLLSGVILAVVFYRMKKDQGKGNVENPQSPEAKPLRSWIGKETVKFVHQVLHQCLSCLILSKMWSIIGRVYASCAISGPQLFNLTASSKMWTILSLIACHSCPVIFYTAEIFYVL